MAHINCIDLTSNVAQCVMCPKELGQGHDKASLMFMLKDCGCVSLLRLESYPLNAGAKTSCRLSAASVQNVETPFHSCPASFLDTPDSAGKGLCDCTILGVLSVLSPQSAIAFVSYVVSLRYMCQY